MSSFICKEQFQLSSSRQLQLVQVHQSCNKKEDGEEEDEIKAPTVQVQRGVKRLWCVCDSVCLPC